MKWMQSEHDPDLYDARLRDWYIKAAASPKEIVILLDTSGSMTGLRKEIAKVIFKPLNQFKLNVTNFDLFIVACCLEHPGDFE